MQRRLPQRRLMRRRLMQRRTGWVGWAVGRSSNRKVAIDLPFSPAITCFLLLVTPPSIRAITQPGWTCVDQHR